MLVSKKQNWEMYQEPAATPAREPLTRPHVKTGSGLRSQCIIVISLVAVMAMLVTLQSASIVKAGYELVQIKAQMAKLEKENDYIKLDIAKLKSPQRIQLIATQQLGMITPKTVYHASAAVNQSAKAGDEGKVATRTANVFGMNKAEASAKR